MEDTLDHIRILVLKQLDPLIQVLEVKKKDIEYALIRYDARIKTIFQTNIQIKQQHCLFDWAVGASRGDKHSISFIRFVTDQVSEVLNSIDPRFINTIKKTGKLLVTTFDDNPSLRNNPRFMNYLGEVAGLNYMLQKEKVRFELLAIEKKLRNSKSADFEFLDKSNNDKIFLEFVSLHGIDPSKIESTEKFKQFLEGRFNEKIAIKTKDLINHHNRIELEDGSKPIFMILPILWSEVEPLLPYRKAFDEINLKYANVLPCVSLLPQLFDDGTVHFSLTAVSNILDRWETMKKSNETDLGNLKFDK